MAVRKRRLGRQPRGRTTPSSCTQTRTRRSSSSRAASNVEVAWLGGETITATGNSFATPHVAGLCALILSKHPRADAVPAEERAPPDREERGGAHDATFAQPSPQACSARTRRTVRCCARRSRSPARSSTRRRRPSSCSTRRRTSSSSRPSRARAPETLLGTRFPSSTGVAGWVLVTRQPLVVDDLTKDTRFSRDAAESTGYVPRGLMAVPLLAEENALGVLEVLDRPEGVAVHARRDGPPRPLRKSGRDRARAAPARPPRAGGARRRGRARRARTVRRAARARGRGAARPPASTSCARSSACSTDRGPRKSPGCPGPFARCRERSDHLAVGLAVRRTCRGPRPRRPRRSRRDERSCPRPSRRASRLAVTLDLVLRLFLLAGREPCSRPTS